MTGLVIDPIKQEKLRTFASMVLKFGRSFTSHDSFDELWILSIMDSMIGWTKILAEYKGNIDLVTDVGSGAGFPAIVISILSPNIEVISVEKRKKAVLFMEMVKEKLKLENFQPICKDIKKFTVDSGIIVSRAVAPTGKFLSLLKNVDNRVPVFLWKGPKWKEEIKQIQDIWYPFFKAEYHLSIDGEVRTRFIVGLRRYEEEEKTD